MINDLKSYINKYLRELVMFLLIIIFAGISILAIRSCSKYKNRNNNNVVALTDSIKYYKTKYGEVYVSKTLLEGDLSTLKLANDSLYNVIKDMKIKNPTSVVYIDNTIDNGGKDTTWTILPIIPPVGDSVTVVYPMITKNFEFNNKFRELEGNVAIKDTTMNLSITKDKVYFDYTLAIKDNKVYVKSNNPYIQYNKIQGLTIPQPKKRTFTLVVGPSINYSYDLQHKKWGPSAGISATFGLDILNIFKR